MDYHISNAQLAFFGILAVWELIWKGFAMWRAARRKEPYWFVAILVVNSVGILPILYLLLARDKES